MSVRTRVWRSKADMEAETELENLNAKIDPRRHDPSLVRRYRETGEGFRELMGASDDEPEGWAVP